MKLSCADDRTFEKIISIESKCYLVILIVDMSML